MYMRKVGIFVDAGEHSLCIYLSNPPSLITNLAFCTLRSHQGHHSQYGIR